MAYKDRCLNPKEKLGKDHYFHEFDLVAHNIHAEQAERLAEQKRIAAETP